MVRLIIRAKLISQDEITEPVELKAQWRPVPLIIAGVLLLAIVAAGIYFFAADDETPPAVKSPRPAPRAVGKTPRSALPPSQAPATETPPAASVPAAPGDAPTAINQVTPVVPPSASETIRGTIRVTVRVVVGEDGKVVTATPEDAGPSRYFERLSLDAARKWTFSPGTREMQVKFNYTRSGTTAEASPIR